MPNPINSSDLEDSNIDTAFVGYGLFICLAIFIHRLLGDFRIDSADIAFFYVDMVEKNFTKTLEDRRPFRLMEMSALAGSSTRL